jgi:DNA invertase Pin-like site-specific DNA recombinase
MAKMSKEKYSRIIKSREFKKGIKARKSGKWIGENPYVYTTTSTLADRIKFAQWNAGWTYQDVMEVC